MSDQGSEIPSANVPADSSVPPPGAQVSSGTLDLSVGLAPLTASATRSSHARSILGSRGFVWGLAFGIGAAFLLGAAMHVVWLMIGGPIAVTAVALALAWNTAAGRAELDFFRGYAGPRKLKYIGDMALLETTPLLGAGDRRRCEHYMEGPLSRNLPGIAYGLSHFTFETREESKRRGGRRLETWTPHHMTICVVDIEPAMRAFSGLHLVRRRGLFKMLDSDSWLETDALEQVELESSSLQARADLFVSKAQDRVRLLRLFSPSFQVWLTQHPAEPLFEYCAGTLVVFSHGRLRDVGALDLMVEATQGVAARVIEEAAQMQVELGSTPPGEQQTSKPVPPSVFTPPVAMPPTPESPGSSPPPVI